MISIHSKKLTLNDIQLIEKIIQKGFNLNEEDYIFQRDRCLTVYPEGKYMNEMVEILTDGTILVSNQINPIMLITLAYALNFTNNFIWEIIQIQMVEAINNFIYSNLITNNSEYISDELLKAFKSGHFKFNDLFTLMPEKHQKIIKNRELDENSTDLNRLSSNSINWFDEIKIKHIPEPDEKPSGKFNRGLLMINGINFNNIKINILFRKYFTYNDNNRLLFIGKSFPIDIVAFTIAIFKYQALNGNHIWNRVFANLAGVIDADTLRAMLRHGFSSSVNDNGPFYGWDNYAQQFDPTYYNFDFKWEFKKLILEGKLPDKIQILSLNDLIIKSSGQLDLEILEISKGTQFYHATPYDFNDLDPKRGIFVAFNYRWPITYMKKKTNISSDQQKLIDDYFMLNITNKKKLRLLNIVNYFENGYYYFKKELMDILNKKNKNKQDEELLLEICKQHNLDGVCSIDHVSGGHIEIFVINSFKCFSIQSKCLIKELPYDLKKIRPDEEILEFYKLTNKTVETIKLNL